MLIDDQDKRMFTFFAIVLSLIAGGMLFGFLQPSTLSQIQNHTLRNMVCVLMATPLIGIVIYTYFKLKLINWDAVKEHLKGFGFIMLLAFCAVILLSGILILISLGEVIAMGFRNWLTSS